MIKNKSMRMISNKNNNNKIKMIINGYHGFNYERIKRFISYYCDYGFG